MENKYSREYLIKTSIGLQDVDGLKNSDYFLQLSEKYIEGEISLRQFDELIDKYYEKKEVVENRTDEADKVSIRISDLLESDSFVFSVGQFQSIHKELFHGFIDNAGLFRTYNIEKKEWVLNGGSVVYGDYREIHDLLCFDFENERNFDYSKLNIDEKIVHLANFISNVWQAHAFPEGNTRTTAVFFIKYLRKLGYDVNNDLFEKKSWYFRNSLARANYSNFSKNIYEDKRFLIKFLRNLLLVEKNKLQNREINVNYVSTFAEKAKNLNPTEKMILDLLNSNKAIKITEISTYLNISERTVKYHISKMRKLGIVERVSGKKFGHWEIIEDEFTIEDLLVENKNPHTIEPIPTMGHKYRGKKQ